MKLLVPVTLLASAALIAADLPVGRPEDAGMSSERLKRIGQLMDRSMQENLISGAVTMVTRKGRVVHYEAHGVADLASRRPMAKDAIFRLASTSKPITAIAIMILVEEGKVRLTDPVSRFLPEFKDSKVATVSFGQANSIAAAHDITVFELLTHTNGLGTGGGPGSDLVTRLYAERKPTENLAAFIPRLAAAPLDFQPGSKFAYSGLAAFDILGRIVEIASGQTYDRFLKERLFTPLGMTDTGFLPPESAQARIPTPYSRVEGKLQPVTQTFGMLSSTYFSGAGGMFSTTSDLMRFGLMLMNGGTLDGHRILSSRTVKFIMSDHVGPGFGGNLGRPLHGMGFGLGGEVVVDRVAGLQSRSNGSYGWDGYFGTHFWVDPAEKIVAVLMVQGGSRQFQRDYENAVMQSLVD